MNTSEFKSKFGEEAILNRLWLEHLACHGTTVAAVIMPSQTESETLQSAWSLIRDLASWLLCEGTSLPANERFEVIVGWSRSVRQHQGQIFKTGGTREDLYNIAASVDAESFTSKFSKPLRLNWQKDVFKK